MTQFIKFFSLLLIPITCLAASPDFEQIDESVVLIINDTSEGQNTGTGFVINDQQNVITNYHVVAGSINLSIADGGIDDAHLKAAQVISVSEEKDLAILYVPNLHRPPIPLTKIEPKKGTPVYAIGFPGAANLLTRTLSTESSIHEGIVGRIIDAAWEENKPLFRIIQHDSEINGGNSGGPLVNRCLQVVGINTVKTSFLASLARGEIIAGLYFASHISLLIEELNAQNIPFNAVNTACTVSNGTENWLIIIAVILALLAIILTLTRPRQQIIQAVETYSQRLQHNHKPQHKPQTDWILSGINKQGQAIHLTITQAQLQKSALTIGRSSKLCELTIKDDSISRRQARLSYKKGLLYIEDLNSLNGTQIDGIKLKPFEPKPLTEGKTLMLGEVKLSLGTKN
jgi:hypothetical protein